MNKDDAGAITLVAAMKGQAIIKRREDGKIMLMYPGSGMDSDWHEQTSPAAAFANLRSYSEKTKRELLMMDICLIGVQPHELIAN